MRLILDILVKLIIGTLMLAAAGVGALFVIGDEELSPAVVLAMEDKPRLTVEQNAFYLLTGLRAPPEVSPESFAYAAVTRVNQVIDESGAVDHESRGARVRAAWFEPEVTLDLPPNLICDLRKGSCAKLLRQRAQDILQTTRDNALLLTRYDRLREFPNYRFDLRYRVLTPNVPDQQIGELHKLWLARALVNADIQSIHNKIGLLRAIVDEADHLLTKLAFIDMLADTLHIYATFTDAGPEAARLLPELALFDENAFSLEAPITAEFRMLAHTYLNSAEQVFKEVIAQHDALQSMDSLHVLFKPRRTINFAFGCYQETLRRNARRIAYLEQRPSCEPDPMEHILNPVGTLLLKSGHIELGGVGPAIRDLDGLVVLVNAKRELVANETPPENVGTFLRERRGVLFHPHTGEPTRWDQRTNQLYFPGSDDDGYANLPYVPLPTLN